MILCRAKRSRLIASERETGLPSQKCRCHERTNVNHACNHKLCVYFFFFFSLPSSPLPTNRKPTHKPQTARSLFRTPESGGLAGCGIQGEVRRDGPFRRSGVQPVQPLSMAPLATFLTRAAYVYRWHNKARFGRERQGRERASRPRTWGTGAPDLKF
jgi:hypothetical protein